MLLVLAESQLDICRGSAFQEMVRTSMHGAVEESSTAFTSFAFDDAATTQTVIMIGWPNDMDEVLLSMSDYITPGGRVVIMSELSIEVRNSRLNANVAFGPQTYEIQHEIGSTTSLHSLRRLPLNEACAVIVLPDTAYQDNPKMSDSAC